MQVMDSRWPTKDGGQQMAETSFRDQHRHILHLLQKGVTEIHWGWGLHSPILLDCLYELTLIAEDFVILVDS